jgi:hypothetical protein
MIVTLEFSPQPTQNTTKGTKVQQKTPRQSMAGKQQFQIQQSSHRKLVFTEDTSPVGTVFD